MALETAASSCAVAQQACSIRGSRTRGRLMSPACGSPWSGVAGRVGWRRWPGRERERELSLLSFGQSFSPGGREGWREEREEGPGRGPSSRGGRGSLPALGESLTLPELEPELLWAPDATRRKALPPWFVGTFLFAYGSPAKSA